MTLKKGLKAALILAACFFISSLTYSAEITIISKGSGTINGPSIQKAEETAKQDAYTKALTQHALKLVPQSSSYAVLNKLPVLISGRGMQDVTVMRIVSKSRQAGIIRVTCEFTLNDDFLRQWITQNRFDIPSELRPRVLLAVTTSAPGETSREWWNSTGAKKYSGFETMLASELSQWGENVFTEAPESRAAGADPLTLATLFKADLLVSGSIRVQQISPSMNQCTLKLNLIDVSNKASIGSWNLSKKADLPVKDMYGIVISSILDELRQKIDQKTAVSQIPEFDVTICVDNIRNYESYKGILNALSATEGVMDIQTSSIYGHSICHMAKIKGTLEDIMLNLKNRNMSGIDIEVKDDSARIVIE